MKLIYHDKKLTYEDLKAYEKLYELLGEQYEEYDKILEADMKLQKKLNRTEKYRQFITDTLTSLYFLHHSYKKSSTSFTTLYTESNLLNSVII